MTLVQTSPRRIGVIGSGAMGAGIAQVAAAAGDLVTIYDLRPEAVERAIADIASRLRRLAEKGRLTQAQAEAAIAAVRPAKALTDLKGSTLIIEAIAENLGIKQKLFGELEALVDDACVFATNTSSLSITGIGAPLRLPQRLVGMHFFNPAPLMELVEIVSGLATSKEVADTVYDVAKAWGKKPVHARSTPGFIVNRVARPFYAEGLRLLNEQSCAVPTLDALMRESGGFRMGPCELMDLIGHDVNLAVTQSVFAAYFNDPRFTPSPLQVELVAAGFLGRKSGRGFYRYDAELPAAGQEPKAVASDAPVTIYGDSSLAKVLATKLHLPVHTANDDRILEVGTARLYLTDGRTATQRSADSAHRDTAHRDIVLVDLALDYEKAPRLGVTHSDQCDPKAYAAVLALLQRAGYAVSRVDDVPGLVVMRTVAMLANEAADTVNQGVCTAADVDRAMLLGVNFPKGPLAWADALGVDKVATVLTHLAAAYGEDRYRVSPLIRRRVAAGRNLHD